MVASLLADTATAAAGSSAAAGVPALPPLPPLTLGTVLAVMATALLVFVSVGVIYLSTVEWRDRRRRRSPAARS
ncbi:MAG: hypothetical protein ACK512_07290 [Cyanobium sp.]|jgi:hypothetical protein